MYKHTKNFIIYLSISLLIIVCSIVTVLERACMTNDKKQAIDEGIIGDNQKQQLKSLFYLYHNDDGGFAPLPPATAREPDLYATYYSLMSLDELSSLSLLEDHRKKTVKWLHSSRPENYTGYNVLPDIFYNVMSLDLLNEEPLNKSLIIQKVKSYIQPNGAFLDLDLSKTKSIRDEDYLLPTYMALCVIKKLDGSIDNSTIEWLCNMWNKCNVLDISNYYNYQLLYKSMQLAGIDMENKIGKQVLSVGEKSVTVEIIKDKGRYVVTCKDPNMDKANTEELKKFEEAIDKLSNDLNNLDYYREKVKSARSLAEIRAIVEFVPDVAAIRHEVLSLLNNMQLNNGGFSFIIPPENDDIQGTYYALSIYNKFDILPKKDKIISLILSNKSDKGGFFNSWHCHSLGITTYYVLSSMKMLGLPIEPEIKSKVISYVNNAYEIEDRSNYLFSLIRNAQLLGIQLEPKPDVIKKLTNQVIVEIKNNNLEEIYFICYVLNYLNHPVQNSTVIEIRNTLKSLQNKDGGFGSEKSSLIDTYYAIKIYKTLGIEVPNRDKTVQWLINHQSTEGIFKIQDHSDMVINYFFVDSLNSLNHEIPNKENIIRWVMKCKNDQYGTFKMLPGNVPNPNNDSDPLLSTYSALFLLNLMQKKA
ncbi:hypothetical protein Tph_c22060 [Thermacetogenium phaeum DSM 12270]|uniref:Geranylgeranyl transferase type II subunit beta n=2 Tax=Thermacetogenium phaeum TaxID=85874 RepID=K4LK10_THEPS|nr:hypothetical protein Tph_c22060 [Thermacetogenium phaeum DSM 12270]